jgi:1,4-dihydroxy-2-naphthoate octaprenyltransferase
MNVWILGSRPRTLPAAVAPVAVATALAAPHQNLTRALLALLVSLALQIGVNYANDYSDGIKGTDTDRIGPTRITASGLATPAAVKRAAILSFSVAAMAGLVLALATSLWLIALGAISIIAAWGYTGGKNPYGYKGLGEISVFLFFGVIATAGSYYVQTEKVTLQSVVTSLPMGALACALLAVNNLRDRAKDALVSKRTLAVRLGDYKARIMYGALLMSAHLFALLTFKPWTVLTLLALPLSASLIRKVMQGVSGAELIPILGKTGKLQLIFAALFAVGLAL